MTKLPALQKLQRLFLGAGKRKALLTTSVSVLFAMSMSIPATAQETPADRYLVVTDDPSMTLQGIQRHKAIDQEIERAGGSVVGEITELGVQVVTSRRSDFMSAITKIQPVVGVIKDKPVQFLRDNLRTTSPGNHNVEYECIQQGKSGQTTGERIPWNIRQINADRASSKGIEGQRSRVAVIDTGINTRHVDLRQNIDWARSRSFVDSETTIEDFHSHGSHISGTIAGAKNNRGIQGVAPRTKLVVLKALDRNGTGTWSSILEALDYAAKARVDVVNMSFGQNLDPSSDETRVLRVALQRAATKLWKAGAVLVASAGNDAIELTRATTVLPAQINHVITVSATGPIDQQQFDRLASYSNYGWPIDVAAPGGDVLSSTATPTDMILSAANRNDECINSLAWFAGTSMATAHVSGVAALVAGKFPKLSPDQIWERIERTSVDILGKGEDKQSGRGRVDALAAVIKK